jgi:hypothetical protein
MPCKVGNAARPSDLNDPPMVVFWLSVLDDHLPARRATIGAAFPIA